MAIKTDIDGDTDSGVFSRKKIRATAAAFTLRIQRNEIARIAILAQLACRQPDQAGFPTDHVQRFFRTFRVLPGKGWTGAAAAGGVTGALGGWAGPAAGVGLGVALDTDGLGTATDGTGD